MRHFIRFTRRDAVPSGEQSRNSLTGELEAGVSVYDASQRPDGSWSCVGEPRPPSWHPLMFTELRLRVVLVTGTVLDGRGSDGEPLLREVQVLTELEPIEGCDGTYVPRSQ